MPGPAPDPTALRRERPSDKATWTTLPDRRDGDPPKFPLARPTAHELSQWAREWARPQAVMWERDGQQEEVAVYVRTLVRCEDRDVGPGVLSALLRLQESLGLSQPGLAKRRWKIVGEEQPVDTRHEAPAPDKARRLRVIDGAA